MRSTIISGLADPQLPGSEQETQYAISVQACCNLARTFARAGYDVAIDDVIEPGAYERLWRPALEGLPVSLVVLLPTLEVTLTRSAAREERVQERHTREQHERSSQWPHDLLIDTTGMSVDDARDAVVARLG